MGGGLENNAYVMDEEAYSKYRKSLLGSFSDSARTLRGVTRQKSACVPHPMGRHLEGCRGVD